MAAFPCCTTERAATGNAGPAFGDQPSRASQMFTTVQLEEQHIPSANLPKFPPVKERGRDLAPPNLVKSALKLLRPSSLSTTASPSICAVSTPRPRTASAIPKNRSVKSAPRRLQIFARSPSLGTRMRKRPCFTSCSQPGPAGGRSTSEASSGRMKPGGGIRRHGRRGAYVSQVGLFDARRLIDLIASSP